MHWQMYLSLKEVFGCAEHKCDPLSIIPNNLCELWLPRRTCANIIMTHIYWQSINIFNLCESIHSIKKCVAKFSICQWFCAEPTAICIFWVGAWVLNCQRWICQAFLLFDIWSKYDIFVKLPARVDNFMFNPIYSPITCLILNLIFLTISFDNCQNLQWWLGLVWFACHVKTEKNVEFCKGNSSARARNPSLWWHSNVRVQTREGIKYVNNYL